MLMSRLASGLVPYTPGEQPKGGKVIKLNTNENPYPPSPRAAAAIASFDTSRLRLYPDPTADALRAALADAEGVREENVFVGNGSDEVLSLAFAAFFDDASAPVIFPDVTYSFYKVFCALYRINFEEVRTDGGFAVRVNDYLGRETSGIVLANPNAPTGLSLPSGAFRTLCAAYPDKVIIADEAYVDFSPLPSLAALTAEYSNLLVVKTFSKSRSLAGGRCGYAIGDASLIRTLRTVKNCFNSYTVNALTAAAAREAVLDTEYFADCVGKIKATREKTAAALRGIGFRMTDSGANFLFAEYPGMSGEELQLRLRARGIIVRRFDSPRIKDFLRITIGTEEDMDAFVRACAEITGK